MTHDLTASRDINAPPYGSGFMLPLVASTILTLIWGAYTIWVSLEIIPMRP